MALRTATWPVSQAPDRRVRASAHAAWRLAEAVPQLLLLPVGVVLWATSLARIDPDHLGSYGLPPELPLTWYAGLGLLVTGAALAATRPRPRPAIVGVFVLAIIGVLYGTVPLVAAEPHYAWTYKHIGVTRFLIESGQVDPGLDIYNRWPGFFALAAAFSQIAGASNPLEYARWAELLFMPVATLMLAIGVRAIAGDPRVASLTAILFVVTAWVGQMYFAPQALAFVLGLAVIAVCLGQLTASGPSIAPRARAAIARLARVPQRPFSGALAAPWPAGAALAAALFLYAVVVTTHQLTPFVLLFSVAGLCALGFLAPRWIAVAMAGIVLGYLALNFEFVRENFSIFTGLDPVRNAEASPYDIAPAGGKLLNAHVAKLLPIAMWLGGALGFARLAKRGLGVQALPLLVLALAPFAILFAQRYGGEASLRVILFSTPWCAALIAWSLTTIERPRLMRPLAAALCALLTTLFVPAFLGTAQLNIMPPDEVRASEYLYEHGRPGAVVMLVAPNFPARVGPSYPDFAGPQSDADPNLLSTDRLREKPLGAADIPRVISTMRGYARTGYLVFSKTQLKFARLHGLTPPGELRDLERAVAASRKFEPFHLAPRARIYSFEPGRQ